MDIQVLLNAMSDIRKSSAGNITIGRMLKKLDQFQDDELFEFTNGKYFDGSYGSYRGYYEDLYLGYSDEDQGKNTIGDLKKTLRQALEDKVMFGYKGGDFVIDENTLVWLSTYGRCGDLIVDVIKLNNAIYVVTKEDENWIR